MTSRRTLIAAAGAGLAGLWPAPAAQAQSRQASATGQVRRIDAAHGKVTIKHGEIKDLDLPAMTLVYHADPAMLAGIKAGDDVRFTAVRKDTAYVLTSIDKR